MTAADRWPFTMEKWYVDTLADDGAVLILYFGRIAVFGRSIARFTADLFLADGSVVRGDATVPLPRRNGNTIVYGPAVMEPERIVWQTDSFSGELRFTPRFDPVELRAPFLQAGDRRLTWHVEMPDAEVAGVLRWGGRDVPFSGRGYRDRVWFDISPWKFPIRELRWGRAVAGTSAAVWVEAVTAETRIAARWIDGRLVDGEWPVEIRTSRTLLETAVVDVEGLRFRGVRPIVRLLTGDPFEVKWAAHASIAGVPGVAIHERVRWRGGRDSPP